MPTGLDEALAVIQKALNGLHMSNGSQDKIRSRALSALLKRGLEKKVFTPTPEQIDRWKKQHIPQKPTVTENAFELVLVSAEDDLQVLFKYLPFYQKNLCPTGIAVITKSSEQIRKLFADTPVRLINEDEVLDGLTFDTIKSLNPNKPGWYFQQFLKMAYAEHCKQDYYLIFDGDTVPLAPLTFFQDGKGAFLRKGEYFAPYFNMIEAIFSGEVTREVDFSFIAESMLIKASIMRDIVATIESNKYLVGETFYEKILNTTLASGLEGREFSEYETYGNYVMKFHANEYEVIRIRSLREGMKFFKELPEHHALEWLSRDFDTVSFERKHAQETPLSLAEYINKSLTA